jgi:homoserine kinase
LDAAPRRLTATYGMRASAPASSANLGPGFDVLALALAPRVEVTVEHAPRLAVRTEGEGADLPQDETHLAARVAIAVTGHDRLSVQVRSEIPVSRGLGSSAALAVAAAAAAGSDDPLGVAAEVDGHAENAAASVAGGLVAATFVDGGVVVRRLPLDPALAFVVLVPERRLATKRARATLPETVPLADAVFDIGRLPLLIAGLADHTLLLPAAADDRLHQPARSALFPEADALIAGLVSAGALIACWSGAGTCILGACARDVAPRLRDAGEAALASCGVAGASLLLEADLEGLRVHPA